MAPVWRSSQPAVSKSGSAIVGIDGGDLGRGVSSMPAPKSTTDDILVNLELPKKIIFDNVKIGDLLAQQVVDAIPSLPNKTHLESIVVRADNHPKGCKNKKDQTW